MARTKAMVDDYRLRAIRKQRGRPDPGRRSVCCRGGGLWPAQSSGVRLMFLGLSRREVQLSRSPDVAPRTDEVAQPNKGRLTGASPLLTNHVK